MKIKTEILKGTFILTFSGICLDSVFAHGFFNAMRGSIEKGDKNIVLDFSGIESVNNYELGMMVRSLREINGDSQPVLCGVNGQVLDLLRKSQINDSFIHAASRDEALSNLPAQDKKVTIGTVASAEPITVIEEDWLELVEVVSDEEEDIVEGNTNYEKRKHRRIDSFQILDEDLKVNCFNTRTGKQFAGTVLNISPGGMLILAAIPLKKEDELIIQGKIGRNFKLKVAAVIRSCMDGRFGVEFSNPSREIVSFLNQLIGSVGLQKSSKSQM